MEDSKKESMTAAIHYIPPITKTHATFTEAKKSFDGGGFSWYEKEGSTDLASLAQGKRSLILGEPGVGKSLLIQRLQEHLDGCGVTTCRVELRQMSAMALVESFLAERTQGTRAILLDALDEVKASAIPEAIEAIERLAQENPDVAIFLSGRWVFISRYASRFSGYRIITISPFTNVQVRAYLTAQGHSDADVDALLSRMMSFGHSKLVVQIPRYLSYLNKYLEKEGVEATSRISRNELFEYFIYSKLDLEDKKLNTATRAMTKRILEKLALTMETFQTNVIREDELMTFFDEVKSDLTRVALSQIDLEKLYDYSILKVSHEDPDKIEFDNAEFQEYLAAKEITRLPEPTRAAFSLAADGQINEIYPTWYNTLTFLVDMEPALLEQLVEFSGLRADKFRVLDERFLNFVGRVDARRIPKMLRGSLFRDLVSYHERTLQWMSHNLAGALPGLADSSTDEFLQERATHAESRVDPERFVCLANIAYAVAYLIKDGFLLDKLFWRRKLIEYASDRNTSGVLQRHALFALGFFRDTSVIDELPALSDLDELGARELLDACKELSPDHPRSVDLFIDAIRQNNLHGRYGLYEVRATESIKKYLNSFLTDEDFRREFMDDTTIFKEQDRKLVERIDAALDPDLRELSKQVLVAGMHWDIAHQSECSDFMSDLWKTARKGDDSFIADLVSRISEGEDRNSRLLFSIRFFSKVIEESDVEPYINAIKGVKGTHSAHQAMLEIKFSGRPGAERTYESGRSLLRKEYEEWERASQDNQAIAANEDVRVLEEFRLRLEPEPGKYRHDVFRYYNDHVDTLDRMLLDKDRARLLELLSGTVFKLMDPGDHGLTIKSSTGDSTSYTVSAAIQIFGNALITATKLRFDLAPYRTKIINLIPFAYDDDLKVIFEHIRHVQPGELNRVIEVYRTRHSDLWRHNPTNFVRAVERFHVTEAVPVLKSFVEQPGWDQHARREALRVVTSVAPDATFLRKVFERHVDDANGDEKELAVVANELLITAHGDPAAIQWRLQQVVQRAAPFVQAPGGRAHPVGALEEEMISKAFAKPLMELKHAGYETGYITMLESALKLWKKGEQFHEYASYLWTVVLAYFENLKEQRSYEPLQRLETSISTMKGRDGANWLAGRIANLRQAYLSYLGRPTTIAKAIAKYNDARKFSDKEIRTSAELLRHVQATLDGDLRRWIEGEGAYNILQYKVFGRGRQEYEKLIQKTLKVQIENILMKRGFQVEIAREEQLLDDKRADFLVRYGFVGPIVIEVKLTSNTEIQGNKIRTSKSFQSMDRYMRGYGASHGIFMVIDNIGAKNLSEVGKAFTSIRGVSVISFDCATPSKTSRAKRAKGKSAVKMNAGRQPRSP